MSKKNLPPVDSKSLMNEITDLKETNEKLISGSRDLRKLNEQLNKQVKHLMTNQSRLLGNQLATDAMLTNALFALSVYRSDLKKKTDEFIDKYGDTDYSLAD